MRLCREKVKNAGGKNIYSSGEQARTGSQQANGVCGGSSAVAGPLVDAAQPGRVCRLPHEIADG